MLSKALRLVLGVNARAVGYCLTCRANVYEHELKGNALVHVGDGLYAHAKCARRTGAKH